MRRLRHDQKVLHAYVQGYPLDLDLVPAQQHQVFRPVPVAADLVRQPRVHVPGELPVLLPVALEDAQLVHALQVAVHGPELGRPARAGLHHVPEVDARVAHRLQHSRPLLLRQVLHLLNGEVIREEGQQALGAFLVYVVVHAGAARGAAALDLAPPPARLQVVEGHAAVGAHNGGGHARLLHGVPVALARQGAARQVVCGPMRPQRAVLVPPLEAVQLCQLGHGGAVGGAARPVPVHAAELGGAHQLRVRPNAPGRAQVAVGVVRDLAALQLGLQVQDGGDGQPSPAAVRNVVVAVRGPKVVCGEHVAFVEVQVAAAELGQVLEVLDVVPVGHGEFGINRLQALLKKNGER
mmetsp:Transcript_6209/g.8616  ORF Transcript_6209/g.8616 Transcript_6209/m.8616 type:complete len:351 (+) Transcript_6209:198-1250(+)